MGNQFWRKSDLFGPSFLVIHLIPIHSAWFKSTFLNLLKLLQIKEGGLNFWGVSILQKVWIIWSPLLYFSFKGFRDPNLWPAWFRRTFLRGLKFLQIKERDLISGGNQLRRKSELFGLLFCISMLKVLNTKFLCHSLDFNAFYMIQEYFSEGLQVCTN